MTFGNALNKVYLKSCKYSRDTFDRLEKLSHHPITHSFWTLFVSSFGLYRYLAEFNFD